MYLACMYVPLKMDTSPTGQLAAQRIHISVVAWQQGSLALWLREREKGGEEDEKTDVDPTPAAVLPPSSTRAGRSGWGRERRGGRGGAESFTCLWILLSVRSLGSFPSIH